MRTLSTPRYIMAPTHGRRTALTYENIIVEKAEGVGTVTLNRPDVLNAISRGMYREIDDALGDMEADPCRNGDSLHRNG